MTTWLKRLRHLGHPVAWRARRARLVTSPAAFFWAEYRRPAEPRCYQLADGPERVLIRHDNREDSFILSEIFEGTSTYEIPPAVISALGETVEHVVDIGGNIGLAAVWFARAFPAAHFTIVEADPTNADVLERMLALNTLHDRATLIRAAAGPHDGELPFVLGLGGRSHAAGVTDPAATTIPMVDALPLIGACDLLKMDIEGGEWAILSDPRFAHAPPRALCLEYHLWNAPDANPATAIQTLLINAGMGIVELREEGHGGVVWATRRDSRTAGTAPTTET